MKDLETFEIGEENPDKVKKLLTDENATPKT